MATKTTTKYGRAVSQFLLSGYRDYLAARVLMYSGLLPQSAILASTAVEKYFKAMLAFRGNTSHGHLKRAHRNAAMDFDPGLETDLSEDFLKLLQRAYKLRYVDDLEIGFNLVIASREFLAELDYTVNRLQVGFKLSRGDVELQQAYHIHKGQNDPRLLTDNYLMSGEEKTQFTGREPQLIYEVRHCPVRGICEINYLTAAVRSDSKFLRPAYVPLDTEGKSYKCAFTPLPHQHAVSVESFRATHKPESA